MVSESEVTELWNLILKIIHKENGNMIGLIVFIWYKAIQSQNVTRMIESNMQKICKVNAGLILKYGEHFVLPYF